MTVGELIETLKKFPLETSVVMWDSEGDMYFVDVDKEAELRWLYGKGAVMSVGLFRGDIA